MDKVELRKEGKWVKGESRLDVWASRVERKRTEKE
jgi:hypothetical protein